MRTSLVLNLYFAIAFWAFFVVPIWSRPRGANCMDTDSREGSIDANLGKHNLNIEAFRGRT